jgi:hypothetical protein
LLTILERLRNGEREVVTVNALFNRETVLHESCIKIEMFIYNVIENNVDVYIEKGYTLLGFIKSLAMSHSTSVLSGICKYYYAMASQNIVQKLPFPSTTKRNVQ